VDEDGEGCAGMVVVRDHSKREKGGMKMETEERDEDGCQGLGFPVWGFWSPSEEREEEVKGG